MRERPPVTLITRHADLARWLERCRPEDVAGWDTEADIESFLWGTSKKRILMPTTGRIVGFSLWSTGVNASTAIYVPVRHQLGRNIDNRDGALRMLYGWLRSRAGGPARTWAHNLGFDLQMLVNEGFDPFPSDGLDDSMVAAWEVGLCQDRRGDKVPQGLKFLVSYHGLAAERADFDTTVESRRASEIPSDRMLEYAAWDAYDTALLGETALKRRPECVPHYRELSMPLVETLREIESGGWELTPDPSAVDTITAEMAALAAEFEALTATWVEVPCKRKEPTGEFFKNGKPKYRTVDSTEWVYKGADISKDQQVSRWLYDELGWWPTAGLKRNDFGFYTTSKDVLDTFVLAGDERAQRALDLRMDYQERKVLLGTFVVPCLEMPKHYPDGRLHPRLKLTGTQTGRFSASQPNSQNLPSRSKLGKMIRKWFTAPVGYVIVAADMSQAELRYAAHFSRDPLLMAVYNETLLDSDGKPVDIHTLTLEALREYRADAERTDAKIVNFSSLYNITAKKLAAKMKCSEEVAQQALDAFYAKYTHLPGFITWCNEFVSEHGYMRTIGGFRRYLDNKQVKDRRTGKVGLHWTVRNQTQNTAIQGSVADHAKKAMILVDRELKARALDARLAFQEHDSIGIFCREGLESEVQEILVRHLETAYTLRVKMRVDAKVGKCWADTK